MAILNVLLQDLTPSITFFPKNFGMRIDHLLVTAPLKHRVVWAEIDREARKGKPLPSDHAPLVIDIDSPGYPFDAGWASADARSAVRLAEAAMSRRVGRYHGASDGPENSSFPASASV
jgi:hypothetical protein